MKKTYRFLRIKSKNWADFTVNTVFALLVSILLVAIVGYILFNKNELTENESGWGIVMIFMIVFLLLFSITLLYVVIRKRIRKDWDD